VSSGKFILITLAVAVAVFAAAQLVSNNYLFFAGYVVLQFVVLATDCPAGNIPTVKSRLLAAIEVFNADSGRRYELSMSIGVAAYDPPGAVPRTIEELLVEADERMYEEKVQTYRGSTAPRSSVVCQRPSARTSTAADLRRSSLPPSQRAASLR